MNQCPLGILSSGRDLTLHSDSITGVFGLVDSRTVSIYLLGAFDTYTINGVTQKIHAEVLRTKGGLK